MEKAFNRSLENLNLGYIDLYLIHSPIAFKPILKDPSLDPNDVDSYQFHPKDKNGLKLFFYLFILKVKYLELNLF